MSFTTRKPDKGQLIWVENGTGRTVIILRKAWALLQMRKKELQKDPQFKNGKFRITHIKI